MKLNKRRDATALIHVASTLTFAAAASLDSLIIGFHYGAKGVRINNAANAFLSLVCFGGTLLSMLLGRAIGGMFDPLWGNVTGGFVFALLGLFMLHAALFPRRKTARHRYSEHPEKVDKDGSRVIELRESALIGLLLCLNNVGLGIGGGMAGIPLLFTPIACALFSFGCIRGGCRIGRCMENDRFSKGLETLSAVLILLLGARELLAAYIGAV